MVLRAGGRHGIDSLGVGSVILGSETQRSKGLFKDF